MCCFSAACVGGMFPKACNICVKSCFLASFTHRLSLVLSYRSTTKCSTSAIVSSLISPGMWRSSSKASATSGNAEVMLMGKLWESLFPSASKCRDSVISHDSVKDGQSGTLSWVHCGNQFMNSYVHESGSNTKCYPKFIRIYLAEWRHSHDHHISINSTYSHLLAPLLYSICQWRKRWVSASSCE